MSKWISAFIQGALWTIVPAALGQGFCVPSDDFVIVVGEPRVEDGALYVSLHWPLETSPSLEASIEVLDRGGAVVASAAVAAQPGREVAYGLTEDADFFQHHGYWYTFRLVDSKGELLAPEVSGLVTFCQGWESCTYRMIEGVGGDAVGMSTELFGLIDDLESRGSRDLLNDALAARPDLDFEIYWVADQIGRLQAEDPGPDCVCMWFTDLEFIPPKSVPYSAVGVPRSDFEKPDWQEVALTGPGAALRLAGQMLGGAPRTLSTSASGWAGLHLRCRSAVDWKSVEWAGLDLLMPSLDPCASACPDAKITVSAKAYGVAVANAWGTADHGALGHASATAEFFMGGSVVPVFTASVESEVNRPPGALGSSYLVHDSGPRTGGEVVWKRDATAAFSAFGKVEACLFTSGAAEECRDPFVRPLDDMGSWAYGCTKLTTSATLVGEASCALEPTQTVELKPKSDGGGTEDGVLIVPWRP